MTYILLIVIYLAYISIGLPNGILSSAWPTMHIDLGVALSGAGTVSAIMSACTILSSLMTDGLIRRFGTRVVVAGSIAFSCMGLLGFSVCAKFWQICLCAVPYGLAMGSIDASLNNYVAVHYPSRHLSWMHCMWGLGASIGPYIISFALTTGGWRSGYMYVGLIQLFFVAVILLSFPLWKKAEAVSTEQGGSQKTSGGIIQTLRIPGAPNIIITFFCYCAVEKTAILWSGSYLAYSRGFSENAAAAFVSLFFIGMTVGRAVTGFATLKLNDKNMVRMGVLVSAVGTVILIASHGESAALVGFFTVGLGFAPIYPAIIHMTPQLFGAERSQGMIGTELAGAYIGSLSVPPLFGLLANSVGMDILPYFLIAVIVIMTLTHERLHKICAAAQHSD